MPDKYGVPQPDDTEDYQHFMVGLYDMIEAAHNLRTVPDVVEMLRKVCPIFLDDFEANHPGYRRSMLAALGSSLRLAIVHANLWAWEEQPTMLDNCRKCGAVVALHLRDCPVCNTPAGFPNVKVADSAKEVEALTVRYDNAMASAKARGLVFDVLAFENAVATTSEAVMNRSLGALSTWLNGQSELFYSFWHQVRYLGRQLTETEWDQQRGAAEAAINPYYYENLNFAALTLDGQGMFYYGPYSVILKSLHIEDRASVFEKNPFSFCKTHHVVAGQAPPSGYRASWKDRARLAVAKLQPQISPGRPFADIVMEARRGEPDCDFVEVHVFGPIHRLAIERIVGPEPKRRADRTTWRQIVRKAKELGAEVEVTT